MPAPAPAATPAAADHDRCRLVIAAAIVTVTRIVHAAGQGRSGECQRRDGAEGAAAGRGFIRCAHGYDLSHLHRLEPAFLTDIWGACGPIAAWDGDKCKRLQRWRVAVISPP